MSVDQPRLRVLVVENEGLLRLAVEEMLLELGHEIVGWANRARIAIDEAERTQPDVVLMDIQLDGPRDGIDAAHEIRSRFGIPSLFMTGATDPDTYRRALIAQPLGYLRKPLLLEDLKASLNSLSAVPRGVAPPSIHATPAADVQFVSFDTARKSPPDSSD
ncbi:MAG: response regulator [Rhodospirillales bacterium]|nr:response regulator [Rhodospirillales bacterium]